MDAKKMYDGVERAVIKPKNLHGKVWQNKKKQVAGVMQGAFDFYYKSHKAIAKMGDISDEVLTTERDIYITKLRLIGEKKWEIEKNLRATANNSYIGNDLKWAFEHLAENKGHWYDETWDGWQGKCNIPQGIANFLREIEEKGSKIVTKFAEFEMQARAAKLSQEKKKWGKLPEQLSLAQKSADYALPMIWVGAGSQDFSKIENYSKLMTKWIGYGAKAHSILDATLKISSNPKNWKRSALEELSKFVLNKLPIFGSLYAGVISDVPKLMKWFEDYGERTRRAIDNAN